MDSIGESETIKSVNIEVTANHDTKSLSIPVIVLEKPDSTLHQLAARSMLDDLERGRSNIHLGSNRPYPGSWAETNMVRKEAEEIACKWSLVSKWTSFFLAEEPDSPTGQGTPIDGVVHIDIAPGDDLLQPRGAITLGDEFRSEAPELDGDGLWGSFGPESSDRRAMGPGTRQNTSPYFASNVAQNATPSQDVGGDASLGTLYRPLADCAPLSDSARAALPEKRKACLENGVRQARVRAARIDFLPVIKSLLTWLLL